MRGFVLAAVAIQIGLALPAFAEDAPTSDRAVREALPLFEKNHCAVFSDLAEQLFCGDGELNAVVEKLNGAIQQRLNRIPNHRLAIEENAEWIKDRNSSCGIFSAQTITKQELKPIEACLLKETEERIAILEDANFDCLATNTTAGMLICSDPALAVAKMELNVIDSSATAIGTSGAGHGVGPRRNRCGARLCSAVEGARVPVRAGDSIL